MLKITHNKRRVKKEESKDPVKSEHCGAVLNDLEAHSSSSACPESAKKARLWARIDNGRREGIKQGLDELQQLLPVDEERMSQAAVLHHAASFIRDIKGTHEQLHQELSQAKQELETLKSDIEHLQNELPDGGTPLLNRASPCLRPLSEQFEEHVVRATQEDWRYFVFAHIVSHTASSFDRTVAAASFEELTNTAKHWLDNAMALTLLRSEAFRKLAKLTRHTSILTSPSKLPEESRQSVLKNSTLANGDSTETSSG